MRNFSPKVAKVTSAAGGVATSDHSSRCCSIPWWLGKAKPAARPWVLCFIHWLVVPGGCLARLLPVAVRLPVLEAGWWCRAILLRAELAVLLGAECRAPVTLPMQACAELSSADGFGEHQTG